MRMRMEAVAALPGAGEDEEPGCELRCLVFAAVVWLLPAPFAGLFAFAFEAVLRADFFRVLSARGDVLTGRFFRGVPEERPRDLVAMVRVRAGG
jgi:hypothetical protein